MIAKKTITTNRSNFEKFEKSFIKNSKIRKRMLNEKNTKFRKRFREIVANLESINIDIETKNIESKTKKINTSNNRKFRKIRKIVKIRENVNFD